MKNIHILSTDKPSRLYLTTKGYMLDKEYSAATDECSNKNIYITSDEKIEDEEWHLHYYKKEPIISKSHNGASEYINLKAVEFGYKKIILTTDPDLIKDGLQDIDDGFLEWLVKNPNCGEVKTYLVELCTYCGKQHCDDRECRGWPDLPRHFLSYPGNTEKKIITFCEGHEVEEEIITLKEELKQETIAEASQVYLSKVADGKRTTGYADEDFTEGAKWQHQRSYIEEDLKTAFTQGHDYTRDFINQFTDGHLLNELSDKEWTVSRFLLWLEANKFEIIKHNGSN